MDPRAGGENRPQLLIASEMGNSIRNALDVGWNEDSRLIGQNGIRYAADRGGDAWQAAGRGFEIDEAKSLDPAGGFRQAGEAEQVRRAVDVADNFVWQRAEQADIDIDRIDLAPQRRDMVGFAIRTDHQPGDALAQIIGKSR